MLYDIESALVEFIRDQWPEHGGSSVLREFDIGSDFEDIIDMPAMAVATEAIALKRNSDGSINFKPVLSTYWVFKHPGKPEGRRKGISPILIGAISILANQTFGLEIEPLMPTAANEVAHQKLKDLGAIAYRIPFVTNFDVDQISTDDAQRLLQIGISYYDTIGAGELRATDEIEYEES